MRLPKTWPWSKAPAPSGRILPFPAVPNLRTALLDEWNCFDAVATFPDGCWSQVSSYAPEVLAGETAQLQSFFEQAIRNAWSLDSVNVAVFAFTVVGQKPITSAQRELLWRAFRVPVYELLVDKEAGVLAAECESHEGWHIRNKQVRFELETGKILFQSGGRTATPLVTGLFARGLDSCCACGDDSPLLRDVQWQTAKLVRSQAVSA